MQVCYVLMEILGYIVHIFTKYLIFCWFEYYQCVLVIFFNVPAQSVERFIDASICVFLLICQDEISVARSPFPIKFYI